MIKSKSILFEHCKFSGMPLLKLEINVKNIYFIKYYFIVHCIIHVAMKWLWNISEMCYRIAVNCQNVIAQRSINVKQYFEQWY